MQASKSKSRSGLPWQLDGPSKQAIKDAVENADPHYVDMLAGRIAQKLGTRTGTPSVIPAREARPTIVSEMGGMGFDLASWIHQHPYKLIAMGLGLAGGVFVFIRGINYYFGKK